MQTQITGPLLVKVWDTPGSGYSERMKHVIEPWVTINRITAIDNFDSTSCSPNVDRRSRFAYSLENPK